MGNQEEANVFKIVVVGVVMAALGFLAGVVVLPALGEDRAASQAAVTEDQADVAAAHESCEAGEMGDMQAMMESMAVGDEAAVVHESCEAGDMGDMEGMGAMMGSAHSEESGAADGASTSDSGMMGSGMMGMMGGHMH